MGLYDLADHETKQRHFAGAVLLDLLQTSLFLSRDAVIPGIRIKGMTTRD